MCHATPHLKVSIFPSLWASQWNQPPWNSSPDRILHSDLDWFCEVSATRLTRRAPSPAMSQWRFAPFGQDFFGICSILQLCQGNSKNSPNSWLFGLTTVGLNSRNQSRFKSSNHKPLAHLSHELLRSIVCAFPSEDAYDPKTTFYIIRCCLRGCWANSCNWAPVTPWAIPIDLCFSSALILTLIRIWVHCHSWLSVWFHVSTSLMKRPVKPPDKSSRCVLDIETFPRHDWTLIPLTTGEFIFRKPSGSPPPSLHDRETDDVINRWFNVTV